MNEQDPKARWAGRQSSKDQLRATVWSLLEKQGYALGSPWSKIPDFTGAHEAADRLASTDEWRLARIVKCNPDRGQAWVRLRALEDGKRVYTPVPELTNTLPFVHLDPVDLIRKGIAFTEVMYSDGAMQHGQPVNFDEMDPMDICVVGSVAVTLGGGRTGKGAGFADMEMGLFRAFRTLHPNTPVVSTVHDAQMVDEERILMENHDTPLDLVVTPTRIHYTQTRYTKPGPIDWDFVREDQFRDIPFLRGLKQTLLAGSP